MKITAYRTWIVSLPIEQPFTRIGENPQARRAFIALELTTDEGIVGVGVTSFGAKLTRALKCAVDDFAELIMGRDPLSIEAIRRTLYDAAGPAGPEGIFTLALAAIDIALWDIKGKACNQPLWRLLGGHRQTVPAYASGALMRGMSADLLATACERMLERGFREIKMHLAVSDDGHVDTDLERARLVRRVIGPDIKLMADVNQRWRVDQAIHIGSRLVEFDFTWLEDVTACQDYAGLAQIAATLTTPIAGGELLWGLTPFRQLIEARATDIVMIDLLRAGGITPWMKIAALAEAFHLPVVSHLLPEIHGHLIGAIPNGLTVEYMPWSFRLYEETPMPMDGSLSMSDLPGLGLKLDHKALAHYAP
ncbi:MAG: mandelate racemase/muconate lactonizing enzyme family protein [Steroidobacteraceae bacterium]